MDTIAQRSNERLQLLAGISSFPLSEMVVAPTESTQDAQGDFGEAAVPSFESCPLFAALHMSWKYQMNSRIPSRLGASSARSNGGWKAHMSKMRVPAVLTAALLAASLEAAPAPEPALGVGAVLGALAFGGVRRESLFSSFSIPVYFLLVFPFPLCPLLSPSFRLSPSLSSSPPLPTHAQPVPLLQGLLLGAKAFGGGYGYGGGCYSCGCGGCGGHCGWCGGYYGGGHGHGYGYGRRRRSVDDFVDDELVQSVYRKASEEDAEGCGLRLVCELAQKDPRELAQDEVQILLPFRGLGQSDGSAYGDYDEAAWHGQEGHSCQDQYDECHLSNPQMMGILRQMGNFTITL
ncbi:uncharacterized protein LOC119576675 [Penaeus monodon]|uniref:uncharacterized protein LOC119576675 n=1 Tax=Penaeus monodon TaxID=6687 RepID=UPI0018A6EA11|nr:uncharacterized protein LOC119576675 [Penaeus monodon]